MPLSCLRSEILTPKSVRRKRWSNSFFQMDLNKELNLAYGSKSAQGSNSILSYTVLTQFLFGYENLLLLEAIITVLFFAKSCNSFENHFLASESKLVVGSLKKENLSLRVSQALILISDSPEESSRIVFLWWLFRSVRSQKSRLEILSM